jgi:hypothetical protein
MEWEIVNEFGDGTISYRFISHTLNRAWPSLEASFGIKGYGARNMHRLQCDWNERVCVGAQSGRNGWGVGLRDDRDDDGACAICDGGKYRFTFR